MICSGKHQWKIARENPYYTKTELVCKNCGLVFFLELLPEKPRHYSETPGYRTRRLLEERFKKILNEPIGVTVK